MEIMKPDCLSVLPSAPNADSTTQIEEDILSNSFSVSLVEDTLRRGNVLSIGRPYWLWVTESEQRVIWLKIVGIFLVYGSLGTPPLPSKSCNRIGIFNRVLGKHLVLFFL